jgi:hypothetical protein
MPLHAKAGRGFFLASETDAMDFLIKRGAGQCRSSKPMCLYEVTSTTSRSAANELNDYANQ